MTVLRLHSPAKVNLGLSVGARRPDGFHDITTIIVALEFGDTVTIRPARSGIAVSTSNSQLGCGPDNLAYRAAQFFFEESGIAAGCRIHIMKRIPLGSGLGGGSSNAALVLVGLNRLFGKPLSSMQLRPLAASLGSDVPAFLASGASVARGRGERLRAVRLPRLNLVLHFPGYPVETRWAYSALDRSRRRDSSARSLRSLGRNDGLGPVGAAPGRKVGAGHPGRSFESWCLGGDSLLRTSLTAGPFSPKILAAKLRQGELAGAGRLVRNDFEPVVFKRHPDLARVKRLMLDSGCYAAALSGSGSTVFGLLKQGQVNPMAALKRQGISFVLTRSI